MADASRPTPSIESLSDLGRSEGLRRARLLPAALRAMALGEALPWLDGVDRQRAAAWLIRRAERGEGLEGLSALASRVGRLIFGGHGVPAGQEAVFQLARRWHAVPEAMRTRALDAAGSGRWIRAIDRAIMDGDPHARASAAELAGLLGARLGSLTALERVGPLLNDDDLGVVRAAERALVRATGRAAELEAEFASESGDAEGLALGELVTVDGVEAVIADAVSTFDQHRRFGVLLAAVALLGEPASSAGRRGIGSPLAQWLASKPTAAHGALRTVLRKASLPLARRRAFSWIVMEGLTQAAADRLSRASTPAEHEVVLERAFLTRRRLRASRVAGLQARPKIRQTAATLAAAQDTTPPLEWPEACPVPNEATIERLSADARAGLAEWLSALQVDRVTQARVLAPRLGDDDPRVRYALARHAPPTLVEDLAHDPHPSIARSAVLSMSRIGEPLEATPAATQAVDAWMPPLARHADPVVRSIGRKELERVGRRGAGPLAVCAARVALKRTDPHAAWLIEAIEGGKTGDADERVSAITLAKRLSLPARNQGIRDALLAAVMVAGPAGGLAEDEPRQRVAATAVRALSIAPGRDIGKAIEAACAYPSPRVRANAVEALEDRRRRGLIDTPAERFIELSGDEHQRVRANAVRAGLVGVEGKPSPSTRRACESALRSMLGDERAAHRVSGLWVASRVLRRGPELSLGGRWTDLAAVIADMARHDADASARSRATACLGSLEAEARQRWQRGANGRGPNSKREKGAVA